MPRNTHRNQHSPKPGLCGLLLTALLVMQSGFVAAFEINFRDMVTFGDSLTHNDFLWILYGNPRSMYGDDPFEAVFEKAALSGDTLTNYAVAGSDSDDLNSQINLYGTRRQSGSQGEATLIGFEIGGNDILDNVDLLKAHAPGDNANADAVINRLRGNIRSNLLDLKRDHPASSRYIIWTIPDITFTPRFFGKLSQTEIRNLQAHMQRVNSLIRKADQFKFVAVIDIYKIIRALAIDPPIIKGQQLLGSPTYGEFDAIFADEIHPTAVANAFLANLMIMKLNAKWNDDIPLYTEDELAALARIQ